MELYAPPDMRGKIVLVTGASRGIGYAAARALACSGATVALGARDSRRGAAARDSIRKSAGHDRVELYLCDFDDLDNVPRMATEFQADHGTLDVLINNAGAAYPDRRVTVQGFERTWQVDHLAAFLLTNLLRAPLAAAVSARVVTVSSSAHVWAFGGIDFEDPSLLRRWTPLRSYAQAKLANLMFAYELARRWRALGVSSNAVHPGLVRTAFGAEGWGAPGMIRSLTTPVMISAERGADTVVWLSAAPEAAAFTGEYFIRRKSKRSSRRSYDEAAQRALWELSARQVGLAEEPGS